MRGESINGEENVESTTDANDPVAPEAPPTEQSEAQSVSREQITDLDFDELDLP